ncbi:MAG: hypothetical protein AB7G93_21795 [Bdellovibrionales bacterium]
MNVSLILSLLSATFFVNSVHAATQDIPSRTLDEYFAGKAQPGEIACGVIDNTGKIKCLLALNLAATLTPENDPSGTLAEGTLSPNQGSINQVDVSDVLASAPVGTTNFQEPLDVLLKVRWVGVTKSGKATQEEHFVQGQLELGPNDQVEFKLVSIRFGSVAPFNATRPLGDIFGYENLYDEDLEVVVTKWMTRMGNAIVAKAYSEALRSRTRRP